jgi:hypothetical protein
MSSVIRPLSKIRPYLDSILDPPLELLGSPTPLRIPADKNITIACLSPSHFDI